MNRLRSLTFALASIAALVGVSGGAVAQGLFDPVARVNESIITEFEVQQRVRFLQLLNAPGATRDAVLQGLIDDRLRIQGTRAFGLELTEDGLQTGLNEFAGRTGLTVEEFANSLEEAGVARETLRDFVGTQIAWRDLVRARFGNRVQVSETDIDRALSAAGQTSGLRVLLSEIIIPAPPQELQNVLAQAEVISRVRSEAEFSAFARRVSATASRNSGGRLEWVDLTSLPETLRPLILGLSPGEVTQPLPITNAVALFQLRDIEETDRPAREFAAIEYAAYYINGGRSPAALARAREVRDSVDVCDDLFGIARNEPPEVLERGSLPPAEIPDDIALELAKLDPGEISTALTRANGQTLVVLMLCGRTPAEVADVSREAVAENLRQQRFVGFSDSFLEELRAAATIEVFTN